MKPNQIIQTGILVLVVISLAAVSSCKKEKDLRSKTYSMTTYNSSGVSGTVEFKENDNGSTTVKVHMMGTVNGQNYPAHIHNGPITSPGGVSIDLGPIPASGGMADIEKEVSNDYDDMVGFNGCFVAHDPQSADPLTSYVLVGNIGSNAQ